MAMTCPNNCGPGETYEFLNDGYTVKAEIRMAPNPNHAPMVLMCAQTWRIAKPLTHQLSYGLTWKIST